MAPASTATCRYPSSVLIGLRKPDDSFGHHGIQTIREAKLAHHGEAEDTSTAFQGLTKYDQDSLIEFLKSLRIVPETQ